MSQSHPTPNITRASLTHKQDYNSITNNKSAYLSYKPESHTSHTHKHITQTHTHTHTHTNSNVKHTTSTSSINYLLHHHPENMMMSPS